MKKNQPSQNNNMQGIMKVGKRVAITILVCVPILIVFGYLTRNVLNDALQVVSFMLIMGIAVLIEEIVARKIESKKLAKSILEKNEDVFK